MGEAFQDGVLEDCIVLVASEAGGWVVLIEPGSVGSQVTFLEVHLVAPPRHQLPQSHEGVWGKASGVGVIGGGGVLDRPCLEE